MATDDNPQPQFTEEGALLADTFGRRLLRHLTATDDAQLVNRLVGNASLGPQAEAVIAPLVAIAKQAASAASGPNAAPVVYHLGVLGEFQASLGSSLGTALRRHAGGVDLLALPDDRLLRSLTVMLQDIFPLMLLPEDPWFSGNVHLGAALYRHPEREPFLLALDSDADLSRLFPRPGPEEDQRHPMIFRSTGAGGTTQRELLADVFLGAAWARARVANREAISDVAAELAAVVDLVRRAARGADCEVPVLVAFTGVQLAGVDRIELPFGVLRSLAAHERRLGPPSIDGNLSRTMPDGDQLVISYAGDLVLETTIRYEVRVQTETDGEVPRFPSGLLARSDELQGNIETAQLAALLTSQTDLPLALVPTWRLILDPLSFGPMLGWSDPRALPGLVPGRMSETTADEFLGLARAVDEHRRPQFGVAIRRTISGLMSRGDPSDALVDLVIGWENLFGSTEGELRFRISAAIAWILGMDTRSRAEIQAQAARVYERRSKIVHGSAPPAEQVQETLALCRDLTIRLLRDLFIRRPDVLRLAEGAARSRAVILG